MPHGTAIGGGVQPVSNFIPPPPNRHPNEPPQGNLFQIFYEVCMKFRA